MIGYLRPAAVLAAFACFGSAWSASPSTTSILACMKVAGDAQRLACFDREAAALSDARMPAPAPKLTPEQKIGLPRAKVDALEAPPDAPPEAQIKNFTATLKSVGGGGRQVFELDNGQVWRQSESKAFEAHAGDVVRISKGALGSFFMELQANKHLSTRVSRVR
jgi:hypothetical protein